MLSRTGLFADVTGRILTAGIRKFTPSFQLWSDGASKRRFLYVPPGQSIDTGDMDFWRYPVGTKAWKEFRSGDVLVETRLLEKLTEGSWRMIAYQWRADQSDADAVPNGVRDANGTEHDIPAQAACKACHGGVPDVLLGVSAIQLADASGVTLGDLAREGALSAAPQEWPAVPGDSASRAALGYLHANCGHCHNPRAKLWATLDLRLWLATAASSSVSQTWTYRSTIGIEPAVPWGGATARIEPGNPEASAVFLRMQSRGNRLGDIQLDMPPLASEKPDPEGLTLVRAWIDALDGDAGS